MCFRLYLRYTGGQAARLSASFRSFLSDKEKNNPSRTLREKSDAFLCEQEKYIVFAHGAGETMRRGKNDRYIAQSKNLRKLSAGVLFKVYL